MPAPLLSGRGRLALYLALSSFGAGAISRAQTAAATAPANDQVVNLDPFQVQEDKDNSYGALNSNSITRFNMDLKSTPISADIFDQQFMQDMGQTSVEGMIMRYSAGSGFNTTQASAATNQPGDLNPDSSAQTRGLGTPSYQRDGFLPLQTYSSTNSTGSGYTSTFDIERVEIIKGPESLLYGSGGGAGVINMVSKQARFDSPSSGTIFLQLDEYGHKHSQFDYNFGEKNVAVRVALLDEDTGGRRINVGGPVTGEYVQLAVHAFKTDFRVNLEKTNYLSYASNVPVLTATGDARNGESLQYILATDQLNAPISGANTAGAIPSTINWSNVNSLAGWHMYDQAKDSFVEFTADTKFTEHLSGQFAVGYKNYHETYEQDTINIVAPNVTTNPFPGQWAIEDSHSAASAENDRTGRVKVIRYSVYHDAKDLLGGLLNDTQSILGADYWRLSSSFVTYNYYQINSSGGLVFDVNNARIPYPTAFYRPATDPIVMQYTYNIPHQAVINVGGVNYARGVINNPTPSLVTPSNPLGLVTTGPYNASLYDVTTLNRGIWGANTSKWFDNKLTTLVGFREASTSQTILDPGGTANPAYVYSYLKKFNYQAGANYELLPWLLPYAQIGTSYNPNFSHGASPYGNYPTPSNALGEEAGFKIAMGDKLSGSVAYYHDNSKNELYAITATLTNDINPVGLNNRPGAASIFVNVDRVAQGFEAELTGAPLPNWRMRLSAAWTNGKVGTNNTYAQLYNDQFNEDKNGNVTYADGTIVYVPAAFNSKQLTVPSTTPGAMPLTVTLLSSATSPYYTTPTTVAGNITATSAGGQVLVSGATAGVGTTGHGSILTGVPGLPISNYQLIPSLFAAGIQGPAGSIPVTVAGDVTTGYGVWSFSYTNLYIIPSGFLKGLQLGGTMSASWDVRGYYYYPTTTVTPGSQRNLWMRPQVAHFDGILGYNFKLWRVAVTSQINVYNMFNHYHVIAQPGPVGGFSSPTTSEAYWSDQPREYMWTNTIKF